LTSQIPGEAPYQQIPHLCRTLRRQGDALVIAICGPDGEGTPPAADARIDPAARKQLLDYYETRVRPFLMESFDRSSPLAHPVRAEEDLGWILSAPGLATVRPQLEQLKHLCEERRQLGEQERLHHWLHGWLILHVPLSIALLILGITHALMALYF